jgi:hypothetical protein
MEQDMNIIELAKQAGFHFHDAGYAPAVLHTEPHEYSQKCFERFAHLVRAAALEEAAGVCESEWSNVAEKMYGEECAAAIRALKEPVSSNTSPQSR